MRRHRLDALVEQRHALLDEAFGARQADRDVEQLRQIAAEIRAELAGFDGVTDITDSFRSA